MKDLMSAIRLNVMHGGKSALCHLAQTRFCLWGVTVVKGGGGGECHSEQFNVLGAVRNKMFQIRKIAQAHPNERSLVCLTQTGYQFCEIWCTKTITCIRLSNNLPY